VRHSDAKAHLRLGGSRLEWLWGNDRSATQVASQLPWRFGRLAVAAALGAVLATGAQAQDATFYKDKTIRFIISAGVAGGYVSYARLLASHMGNHIPGKPDFIVQSMPGAGGLLATNSGSFTRPCRLPHCLAWRARASTR
jgi:hypothetical protein